MPASYPTKNDLNDLMLASGIDLTPAQLKLTDRFTQLGIKAFESAAKRKMLATGDPVEYMFSPPLGITGDLIFGRDLVSISSVIYEPGGSSPETWTEGVDYSLFPLNAPLENKPYQRMRVHRDCWSDPLPPQYVGSIKITCKHGYWTSIPDDVWQAMVMWAGAALITLPGTAQSEGVLMKQINNYRVDYGASLRDSGPYAHTINQWMDHVSSVLNQYKRLI